MALVTLLSLHKRIEICKLVDVIKMYIFKNYDYEKDSFD